MPDLDYIQALLDTIAGPESADQYNVLYGGKTFSDYSRHPKIPVPITSGPNKGKTSSAAGRYQFLGPTWDEMSGKLKLPDFSPQSQDRAAWELANQTYRGKTGGDLAQVLKSGDPAAISEVGKALSGQWTSLPGGIEQSVTPDAFSAAYKGNLKPLVPSGGFPSIPGLPENAGLMRSGIAAAQSIPPMLEKFKSMAQQPMPNEGQLSLAKFLPASMTGADSLKHGMGQGIESLQNMLKPPIPPMPPMASATPGVGAMAGAAAAPKLPMGLPGIGGIFGALAGLAGVMQPDPATEQRNQQALSDADRKRIEWWLAQQMEGAT